MTESVITSQDLRGYVKNLTSEDERWLALAAEFASGRVVDECDGVTADAFGEYPVWARTMAFIIGQHALTLMRRFGAQGVAGFSVPNAARDAAGTHLKMGGFA